MIEKISFDSIPKTSTSHDPLLMKFVLSAAGKFPPGKLNSISLKSILSHKSETYSLQDNEILLIIVREGTLLVDDVHAISHDFLIFHSNQKKLFDCQ